MDVETASRSYPITDIVPLCHQAAASEDQNLRKDTTLEKADGLPMIIMTRLLFVILLGIGSVPLTASISYSSQAHSSESSRHAKVIPLSALMKQNSSVSYVKSHDHMRLALPMFPLASSEESSWSDPIIPETFIFSVPDGKVYSSNGIVLVNDHLIKELLWRWSFLRTQSLDLYQLPKPEYISGKVAMIAQEGHANYYHWMVEVLPKLALLEKNNTSYDFLYVSTHLPFMRQTLSLFGISPEKILEAKPDTYIHAQELIVPSAPSLSCYTPSWIVEYLRNKLIPQAKAISFKHPFSKKNIHLKKKSFLSQNPQ